MKIKIYDKEYEISKKEFEKIKNNFNDKTRDLFSEPNFEVETPKSFAEKFFGF